MSCCFEGTGWCSRLILISVGARGVGCRVIAAAELGDKFNINDSFCLIYLSAVMTLQVTEVIVTGTPE